jgi:hypothetical protein
MSLEGHTFECHSDECYSYEWFSNECYSAECHYLIFIFKWSSLGSHSADCQSA